MPVALSFWSRCWYATVTTVARGCTSSSPQRGVAPSVQQGLTEAEIVSRVASLRPWPATAPSDYRREDWANLLRVADSIQLAGVSVVKAALRHIVVIGWNQP